MTKPTVPPKYKMQQLQDYIAITKHFIGDIKEIKVSKEAIEWYKKQLKQVAKNFNIPTTKNHKELIFMGVKLSEV